MCVVNMIPGMCGVNMIPGKCGRVYVNLQLVGGSMLIYQGHVLLVNYRPENNICLWKLIFQPLSARVYVNLLKGKYSIYLI